MKLPVAASVIILPLFAACAGEEARQVTEPAQLGDLKVSMTMIGQDLDEDGVLIQVDELEPVVIPPNEGRTFFEIAAGDHAVGLTDLAPNCEVTPGRTQEVLVPPAGSAEVLFDVRCQWQTRIAFVSDRDGDREIYAMNPDGSELENLTSHPADDSEPRWSPDGRSLAFVSDRAGSRDIYTMGFDGLASVRLTDDAGDDHDPRWSPDGNRIAFTRHPRGGNSHIVVARVDGTGESSLDPPPTLEQSPRWSSDGGRIAFVGVSESPDVWVMNADGTQPAQLTTDGAAIAALEWSPGDDRLAFGRLDGDDWEIYSVGADGSGLRNLTADPTTDDRELSWSADGRRIAYARDVSNGGINITLMNADGSGKVELTSRAYYDRQPTWSSDGGTIAFKSYNWVSSSYDLLTVAVTDTFSFPDRLVEGQGQVDAPAWSPELFH